MYKPYPYQQELIDKTRNSLKQGHHAVLIVSPPGSGKSIIIAEIVRLSLLKGGHVLFMVHRKELIEQIQKTLRNDEIDLNKVTIMTPVRIKNRLDSIPKPTLIITDEAHHSLAKTYLEIYKHFKNVPRVGLTATPWRLSHEGLGHKKDGIGAVYDDMVEGKTVEWLINNHYLAPYTLYGFKTDRGTLKSSSNGDYTKSSMDKYVHKNKHIIHGAVVRNWLKYANNQRTIVYCHSIKFAKEVAQWFNQRHVCAVEADAKTPAKQREQIMDDFRNGTVKVLCNVDLVSEGFNVPDCSCVILLRPTKSLVVYLQQSMRCMRYRKDKQAVIIDQVGNFELFGLPDSYHMWNLEDRKHKSHNIGVVTCDYCYAAFSFTTLLKLPVHYDKDNKRYVNCPNCQLPIYLPNLINKKGQLEMSNDDELTTIKQFKFTTNYEALKNPHNMKTRAELEKFAKAKGYKKGWVFYYIKNHPNQIIK